jgi:hypothetical protein
MVACDARDRFSSAVAIGEALGRCRSSAPSTSEASEDELGAPGVTPPVALAALEGRPRHGAIARLAIGAALVAIVAACVAAALGPAARDPRGEAKRLAPDGSTPAELAEPEPGERVPEPVASRAPALVRVTSGAVRADVWRGAEHLCTTPCTIELAPTTTTLHARRAGYAAARQTLEPVFPEEVTFVLRRAPAILEPAPAADLPPLLRR